MSFCANCDREILPWETLLHIREDIRGDLPQDHSYVCSWECGRAFMQGEAAERVAKLRGEKSTD